MTRSEIDGQDEARPLAAELAGLEIFDSSDIDDSHALATITNAVLLALDVELERAASVSRSAAPDRA